ncbi:MAG: hypothetical protein VX031_04690 [Bacteroidota bacterium]|nr:hypothetical protein [Bacteroidota bacterium]
MEKNCEPLQKDNLLVVFWWYLRYYWNRGKRRVQTIVIKTHV